MEAGAAAGRSRGAASLHQTRKLGFSSRNTLSASDKEHDVTRANSTIALALVAVTVSVFVIGCQNTKKNVPVSEGVTDVSASPTASASQTPTSAYSPSQNYSSSSSNYSSSPSPVYNTGYDPNNAQSSPGGPSGPVGAGSYTVKRGDTLFGIAKARYGDGKQWQKIVNANPGLQPGALKVGQTINLP
jgi:nucleoid-associated protein YgaU